MAESNTTSTNNTAPLSEEAQAKEKALAKQKELFTSDWSVNSSGEDVFGVDKPTISWTAAGEAALSSFSIPNNSQQKSIQTAWENTGSSIKTSWENIGNTWSESNVFDDSEGVGRVADAAASAAVSYFNKKVEKIKSAWTTTQEVTVGDLLGEVAPYCIDWSLLPQTLSDKLTDMFVYILSLGSYDSASAFGEDAEENILNEVNSLMSAMLDDPSIASAVSNLKVVKSMATTMESLTSIVNSAKKIMSVVEPFLPTVEIVADFALAWISGGTSAAKASQETQEYMATLCQELFARAFEILRKLFLEIKIRMPSLLLGALGTLRINESTELKEGDSDKLHSVQNLFDGTTYSAMVTARSNNSTTGKFYSKIKSTLSKTASMTGSYASTLSSGNLITSGSFGRDSETGEVTYSLGTTQWSDPLKTWVEGNSKLWSEQKLLGYKNVSAVMKSYVAEAKRTAGISVFEAFKTGNSEEERDSSNESSVDSTLNTTEEIPTTEEDIQGISSQINLTDKVLYFK